MTLETNSKIKGGAALRLRKVTKKYGNVTALADVDLEVRPGELLTLLGPSGCGKTTLLKAVAGFVTDLEGEILLDDHAIGGIPPYRRNIGVVFQNYALFPHYTVADNVAFGLKMRKVQSREIRQRVIEALRLVQLVGFEDRYPQQLSGGQQQRVALARVIVLNPQLLLLDEPFGALDRKLRVDMQVELKRLLKPLNITTILVTHDQEEAMTMSDRVAVMHRGRVVQCAEPLDIYDRPANAYVADFIGITNFIPAKLVSSTPRPRADVLGVEIEVEADKSVTRIDRTLVLAVRPENLGFVEGPVQEPAWSGTLTFAIPAGPRMDYEVTLESGVRLRLSAARDGAHDSRAPAVGTSVLVRVINPARCRLLPTDDDR